MSGRPSSKEKAMVPLNLLLVLLIVFKSINRLFECTDLLIRLNTCAMRLHKSGSAFHRKASLAQDLYNKHSKHFREES